jgi:DNA-binding NtrC family response regulator
MPGMDGFALLRLAQQDRPGLPVILITGREELMNAQPSPSLPPQNFFMKPFDSKKLLAAITVALQQDR